MRVPTATILGVAGWIGTLEIGARAVSWPSDVIKRVSFREDSWLFSYARHYYQQRFNFIEPRDDLTLDAFLRSGTSASDEAILVAAGRLGIGDLLSLSLIKLSNGQMRRARESERDDSMPLNWAEYARRLAGFAPVFFPSARRRLMIVALEQRSRLATCSTDRFSMQ